MAKDYFSHDYYSRNDRKLVAVFQKYDLKGIGAFWCITEMLYEADGYIGLNEIGRIAFELRQDENFIKDLILNFEIFENDDEQFWSNTAIKRLQLREEKSTKLSAAAQQRWGVKGVNANAMQKHKQAGCKSNAIKEKEIKGKEIKVKESKERVRDHVSLSLSEVESLSKEFSQGEVGWMLDKLNAYKGATGKTYKSDYLAIRNWVVKSLNEEKEKSSGKKEKTVTETRLERVMTINEMIDQEERQNEQRTS